MKTKAILSLKQPAKKITLVPAPRRVASCLRHCQVTVLSVFVFLALSAAALHAESPACRTISTIAGTGSFGYSGDGGQATNAMVFAVGGSAIGPDGSIYFVDGGNYRIRRIAPNGIISTVVGTGDYGFEDTGDGGPATGASITDVFSIAIDPVRNVLYFADIFNFRIRQVNLATGIISPFAGSGIPGYAGDGGPATLARLSLTFTIGIDLSGNVYICDLGNLNIRKVDIATGNINTIAQGLENPAFIAVDDAGNVFVEDALMNGRVSRIDAVTHVVTHIAGGGSIALPTGDATVAAADVALPLFWSIAVNRAGTQLFMASEYQIYKVDLTTGLISLFAGNGTVAFSGDGGPAVEASFGWDATWGSLVGLTVTPAGGLIVSDTGNWRVRYIAPPPSLSCSAGADFSVNEGDLVPLSGSPAGAGAYLWTQLSGTPVTLSDSTIYNPTFSAPQVPIGGETLTFKLTITTPCNTSEDTVNITVVNVNHTPVADAGADQTVSEGSPVTLHGENSFDCDNDVITRTWVQISGPAVTLSNPTSANPTFTAPDVTAGGNPGAVTTLVFLLRVEDSYPPDVACSGFTFANAVDTVEVKVTNVDNPPDANAGTDQTIAAGSGVLLHAESSSDPDGDTLTFTWTQTGGPSVVLNDSHASNPTFTAPAVVTGGANLTFQLLADDGFGGTDLDQVMIHVQNANDPPVCNMARATVAEMWPPSHGLVSVGIKDVSDLQHDPVTISITSVTQDEPTQGLEAGDTGPDAVIQGSTVLLRAERWGKGNGRVYRINFTATDGQGGSCSGSVSVIVPHTKKTGQNTVDDGQIYNSTQ